ncbi:hypothetical protein [Labrys neptuniae]
MRRTHPARACVTGAWPCNIVLRRDGTASALINVARMVGATAGVAVLGSLYAVLGGGPAGLAGAMTMGGLVQIFTAAMAWRAAPANR